MRDVVVLLAALALLGCKEEPPAYRYQLVFDKGSAIRDQGRLYLGDRELGTVERPRERASTGARMAVVSFTLGESARLSERKDLALRYPTPCGLSAPLPVQIADLDEREGKLRAGTHPNIKFRAEVKGEVPSGVEIWVDGSEGAPKVTVGEAILPVDAQPARLFDFGCAETHEVAVDGTAIGEVTARGIVQASGADDEVLERERSLAAGIQKNLGKRLDGPVPEARLFVGRSGACYRSRLVVYVRSEADMGGDRRVYEGRRLYQIFHRPDAFLKKAPSTQRSAEASVFELLAVDCEAP